MLFYRAALPLSCKTLNYAAGVIRRHRKAIGSRWRKLNPGLQALLVLAYLRKGKTFAELAAGFGVGTATAWRYVEETVALLAAWAPRLRQAVRDARKAGYAYVVLDGTLIPIDRVAADRPFYSGKHKKHGMNLQVIASPGGDVLWVSGALPGSVHDKKAELDARDRPPGLHFAEVAAAVVGQAGPDPEGTSLPPRADVSVHRRIPCPPDLSAHRVSCFLFMAQQSSSGPCLLITRHLLRIDIAWSGGRSRDTFRHATGTSCGSPDNR